MEKTYYIYSFPIKIIVQSDVMDRVAETVSELTKEEIDLRLTGELGSIKLELDQVISKEKQAEVQAMMQENLIKITELQDSRTTLEVGEPRVETVRKTEVSIKTKRIG